MHVRQSDGVRVIQLNPMSLGRPERFPPENLVSRTALCLELHGQGWAVQHKYEPAWSLDDKSGQWFWLYSGIATGQTCRWQGEAFLD
jgi:hypothetical protein